MKIVSSNKLKDLIKNLYEKIEITFVKKPELDNYAKKAELNNYPTNSQLTEKLSEKSDKAHEHNLADSSSDGFMSSADKTKLDGIGTGAQKNSDITKTEIEAKLTGTISTHNHNGTYYTKTEVESKIDTAIDNVNDNLSNMQTTIQTNAVNTANTYTDRKLAELVDSAPDAMNTLGELADAIRDHEDVYEAYVAQQATALNNKADKDHTHNTASASANGLMSNTDKIKLDGIESNANYFTYTHPSTHAASMITQSSTHRFVTDTEKSTWNAKASTSIASASANGLMSKENFNKLQGIADNANNYVHPSSHPASMITQTASYRFVTDTEKSTWNSKANNSVATTSENGLMSKADKSKLDNIEGGANNYVHPSTHSASMIVQDSNNRFVTDNEKSNWNLATTKISNLESAVNNSISISKPIIEYNGTKYIIGVTKDGELTCGAVTTNEEATTIIVESSNGTLFKVITTSNCELETTIIEGTSEEINIKDIYLQAPNPYGIIFKLGVLDDGTLITSTISDVRLIDDNILSKEMSWSSSKINESINVVKNDVDSVSNLVDGLNSNINELNSDINGLNSDISNLNNLTNQLSSSINNKLDKSSIITSTSEPSDSDGKDGDIWIMYE